MERLRQLIEGLELRWSIRLLVAVCDQAIKGGVSETNLLDDDAQRMAVRAAHAT